MYVGGWVFQTYKSTPILVSSKVDKNVQYFN